MTEVSIQVSVYELCHQERLEEHVVIEAVEYGIAKPVAGKGSNDWVFDITSVYWLKKAVRLRHDLEIDWVAVSMVIELLKEREALQKANENLQQRLKTYAD